MKIKRSLFTPGVTIGAFQHLNWFLLPIVEGKRDLKLIPKEVHLSSLDRMSTYPNINLNAGSK